MCPSSASIPQTCGCCRPQCSHGLWVVLAFCSRRAWIHTASSWVLPCLLWSLRLPSYGSYLQRCGCEGPSPIACSILSPPTFSIFSGFCPLCSVEPAPFGLPLWSPASKGDVRLHFVRTCGRLMSKCERWLIFTPTHGSPQALSPWIHVPDFLNLSLLGGDFIDRSDILRRNPKPTWDSFSALQTMRPHLYVRVCAHTYIHGARATGIKDWDCL